MNPDTLPRHADEETREARPSAAAVAVLVYHAILSGDMPVGRVDIYRNDVVVRKTLPPGIVVCGGTGRKAGAVITEFGHRPRYRLLHTAKNCNVRFRSMMTLTYPSDFPCDGRLVKKHFKRFRQRLLLKFSGILGIWFLEFQLRGAPHFHIMLSLALEDHGELICRKSRRLSKKKTTDYWTNEPLEKWLKRAWFEVVGSGDEKHLRAGCTWELIEKEDGAIRYAAKHAAKPHQKKVPEAYQNVGKFWGVIGPVEVPLESVQIVDAKQIFEKLGVDAMSKNGRIKKHLWDAAELFTEKQEERKNDDEK